MVADRKPTLNSRPANLPPKYLIRETIDGVPFYYKGYKAVMRGKKKLDDIMGASILQSFIVSYLFEIILGMINKRKYKVLISEPGLHIDHRSNVSGDVLIYDRTVLTPDKITVKYADFPAKICIEVDVKVDTSKISDMDYIQRKTQKLLDFGIEKVIWVFTRTQKVVVAVNQSPWLTYDWNNDIEILEGITINIGAYLKEEGITIDTDL